MKVSIMVAVVAGLAAATPLRVRQVQPEPGLKPFQPGTAADYRSCNNPVGLEACVGTSIYCERQLYRLTDEGTSFNGPDACLASRQKSDHEPEPKLESGPGIDETPSQPEKQKQSGVVGRECNLGEDCGDGLVCTISNGVDIFGTCQPKKEQQDQKQQPEKQKQSGVVGRECNLGEDCGDGLECTTSNGVDIFGTCQPKKEQQGQKQQPEKQNQSAYAEHDQLYHRGYLLHGAPGTGKTSLSLAAAGQFGLDVYAMNLSKVNDAKLSDLMRKLPTRYILLLEDIDAIESAKSRENSDAGSSTSSQCVQ
ncbi:hypothetical protein G3M48_007963 [Beauveria asiatica]|uniref:ATPase AAA-type core domain-containing protein n=1 Tax=Beauveria asiatica TaxID=1069075 RepID=A0AAW0RL60_9HYPO